MEKKLPNRQSFWSGPSHGLRAVWLSLLVVLTVSGTAFGQQIAVTGIVTAAGGSPLSGVTVRVEGTERRAVTSANGRYYVQAPSNGVLTFAIVGRRLVTDTIAGRTRIDVTMAQISYLDQVVVTAYSEQRRGDITGAVASVDVASAARQTGASVLQRLDAVPGITVVAGGAPGARATVRIRGISSFQNNDPLYVVDGTPVQDSYINFLNPDDITSIQVLKDASSASIYGSRASNGVILIETTRKGTGGAPRVTFRLKTGVATPVRGYDDFLITNSLDYFQVEKASYLNAGLPVPTNIFGDPNNPTIPIYTYASIPATLGKDQYGRPISVDTSKYSYPNSLIMPGSAGTDWWKQVFGSAPVADYDAAVRGGGDETNYNVSFGYFDQNGTAKYNRYQRGSVRVNTAFTPGRLSFGENIALTRSQQYGGGGLADDNTGEGGVIGKNVLQQPVIPVYDIKGNFAGGKAIGLGNQSNPLKIAYVARNDKQLNNQVFGNVFGGFDINPAFALKTRFGFNLAQGSFSGFSPIFPENAEATFTNSINQNQNQNTEWTWTNTARYARAFSDHHVDVLVGEEANAINSRFIGASLANLLNTDPASRYIQDALGDASTKNVFSTGGQSALLSYFAKTGYNYAGKYIASLTVRRDGSSRLGPTHQWGTFPAFGLGWRISKEPFLRNNRILSDVMLRYGFGVTGNQLIPSGRIVSQFGGNRGDTYYDVAGTGNSVQAGFRESSLGNPNLRWEENKSSNVGTDVALFDGAVNVVFDAYRRTTDNLLFNPATPGTAGIAAPPIVNIGKMKNTGFDFSVGHSGAVWSATFTGSHYTNTIVSINGSQTFFYGPISTRYGNQVINQVGSPIGSFYGFVANGFFKDSADVANSPKQDGAAPGRLKFKDVNGDGIITQADRTIIGSPHPKFTGGLDLGYRRGNWDLNGTLFGTFGNKIFDAQKEFYVFQDFSTNVRKDLLANSWTPTNLNAKYPRLDVHDNYSHAVSSIYVEDGSYVRLRNVQLGYTLPSNMAQWLAGTRVYVEGENLFTKTNYDGLDPALPAANVYGAAGDIRDQYRGVDRGSYPTNKLISIGLSTTF